MSNAKDICKQIKDLTVYVIESGLCDDQNFPCLYNKNNGNEEVGIKGNSSIALKNISYKELYKILLRERQYNIKMIDGALVGFQYRFNNKCLLNHRLTFFPAPDLEEFQNEPDVYLKDELYTEVIDKRIVKVPFRFDYDVGEAFVPLKHPASHFTLGQYEKCRIPVTSALSPCQFVEFILRNFYRIDDDIKGKLKNVDNSSFDRTITLEEEKVIHFCVP